MAARNRRDLTERNLDAQRKRNERFTRQIRELRERQAALERAMSSLALRVVISRHRR